MPVETPPKPEFDFEEMSKMKTAGQKRDEKVELRRLKEHYDGVLKNEGMSGELPPDVAESLEGNENPYSAARAYVELRAKEGRLGYRAGEHEMVIMELADRFSISEGEAEEILEDAIAYQKSRLREAA